MVDSKLLKLWKIAEANMRHARQLLPSEIGDEVLCEFNEYLNHNELELAMDELDRIGQQQDCPGGFWLNLERAAEVMKLPDRAKEFRQKFLDVT